MGHLLLVRRRWLVVNHQGQSDEVWAGGWKCLSIDWYFWCVPASVKVRTVIDHLPALSINPTAIVAPESNQTNQLNRPNRPAAGDSICHCGPKALGLQVQLVNIQGRNEVWRYGSVEKWRYGGVEVWRYGDMDGSDGLSVHA